MPSLVVSNIPICVSDITILKYLNGKADATHVEHIQPFPDAYHCMNDDAATRNLQLFLKNSNQIDEVKHLFEKERTLEDLVKLQKELNASHKLDDEVILPAASAGRRLSVTTSS